MAEMWLTCYPAHITIFSCYFKQLLYWSKQSRLNVYMRIREQSGEFQSDTLGEILIYTKLGQTRRMGLSVWD